MAIHPALRCTPACAFVLVVAGQMMLASAGQRSPRARVARGRTAPAATADAYAGPVAWTLRPPVDGSYQLELRYRRGLGTLTIRVDATVVAHLACDVTGDWSQRSTVRVDATLIAGGETLRGSATSESSEAPAPIP
jgi:hypothetical protein